MQQTASTHVQVHPQVPLQPAAYVPSQVPCQPAASAQVPAKKKAKRRNIHASQPENVSSSQTNHVPIHVSHSQPITTETVRATVGSNGGFLAAILSQEMVLKESSSDVLTFQMNFYPFC